MEAQAALGRADGRGKLDAIAAVHLHVALVVHPRDTEEQAALRLHDALDDAGLDQLGALLHHRLEGLQHLPDGLEEFFLIRVLADYVRVHFLQIAVGKCHLAKPLCLAARFRGHANLKM